MRRVQYLDLKSAGSKPLWIIRTIDPDVIELSKSAFSLPGIRNRWVFDGSQDLAKLFFGGKTALGDWGHGAGTGGALAAALGQLIQSASADFNMFSGNHTGGAIAPYLESAWAGHSSLAARSLTHA